MSFVTSSEPQIIGMEYNGSIPSVSTTVVKKESPTMPPKSVAENDSLESSSFDITPLDTASLATISLNATSVDTTSPDTTSLIKPWLDDMETSGPPTQSDSLETTTFDYESLIQRPWSDNQDQTILGPYQYYSEQAGKHMRSRLIDAFNLWLEVPTKELTVIKKVVEMLHNASLLYA
jgi:geranylgeranyl diphosphate synthase type 3